MNQRKSARPFWMFLILIALFFVPIILAWVIFNRNSALPEGTTNHGALIQPPIAIAKVNLRNSKHKAIQPKLLRGRWVMMYIPATANCDQVCKKQLYYMRQIRVATGKNRNRVIRVITTVGDMKNSKELSTLLKKPFKGTLHLTINRRKKLALQQGYLYIIDPVGNVMMRFTPKANPSDILKDMQRLLRISQIG